MNIDINFDIATRKQIEVPGGRLKQVAALVYRTRQPGTEVLIITSRGTGRWVLPKGWPIKGKSLTRAALREAYEEAGVRGRILRDPIGVYAYEKIAEANGADLAFAVDVFALEFVRQESRWPERGERILEWVSPDEAAQRVVEPGLKAILREFRQRDPAGS